ncbi:MAG: YfiR/HmsC family protein [Sulfuricurvum sp.]|nr:YfiR/HmsC family protein [Sulfuricurvum sp.]
MTLIYSATLGASIYDDEALTLFSKIIPRMVLMSSQKERIKENIELCIVNDKIDERIALSLIDKLHDAYPNGINNHPLKLTNTSYSTIEKCQKSQLVFLLSSNENNIEKALQYTHTHTAISMSYDPIYLANGVETSLFFGRKVTPYLNINALRKNGIDVDNLLIRISKIYLNEGEK